MNSESLAARLDNYFCLNHRTTPLGLGTEGGIAAIIILLLIEHIGFVIQHFDFADVQKENQRI